MNTQKIILGLGIFVGVLGASLLVAFGILYLKPYLQVRTMEHADCAVISPEVNVIPVKCMCASDRGSSCHSHLPCLRLEVRLYDENVGTSLENVTLYDSYDTFLLQRNALQCSYHKCNRVTKKNYDAVKAFVASMDALGDSFPCYYEPSDPTYAILHIVTRATLAHALFWPSLAVVLGLAILLANVFTGELGVAGAGEGGAAAAAAAVLPPDRLRARLQENRYKRVQAT